MTYVATIGSISSGTMRPEDLLPCFASELSLLSGVSQSDEGGTARLIADANREFFYDEIPDDVRDDRAAAVLDELFDALNEYAPPYFYFGAHPGDGADYGFWLEEDAIETAVRDGDAIKVDDTGDIPANWTGDVFQVSDHGNVTLYQRNSDADEWREVWALV